MMPTLPFHRYIGPGNKSDNGEPVDEDDRIAKQHDIRYDNAKTESDVRKADVDAILKFRKNWQEGNWHSFIGDVGLSIKYVIETYTGVIYPDVPEVEIIKEEPCPDLVLSKFLNLHCPFKHKPFIEKYRDNPYLSPEEKLHLPQQFKFYFINNSKLLMSISSFVWVPPNWPDVYFKTQINKVFLNNFQHSLDKLLNGKNVSKENIKMITKYFQWQYILDILKNKETKDKTLEDSGEVDKNILMLLLSGYAFLDNDGNIHFEKE